MQNLSHIIGHISRTRRETCELPACDRQLRPKNVGEIINNSKNIVQQLGNKYCMCNIVECKMYNIKNEGLLESPNALFLLLS